MNMKTLTEYILETKKLSDNVKHNNVLDKLAIRLTKQIIDTITNKKATNVTDNIKQLFAKTDKSIDDKSKLYTIKVNYKDKKSTLTYIEKALENNFKDMAYLQTQEEFELLKEFSEFEELLEKYNLLNKKK